MKSKSRIEPGLFVLVENPLLQEMLAGKEIKGDKQLLALTQGGDNLLTFIKNFFIQFFYGEYEFVINSFSLDMLLSLEQFFRRRMVAAANKGERAEPPNEMIEALGEYLRIDKDVMGGPYTREVRPLKQLYCKFLPRLFKAFTIDGKAAVENYDEVIQKIDENLHVIKKVCGPQTA